MRDTIAIEVVVLIVGAYLCAMFGLSLLIGEWMWAVFIPTAMPMFSGAFWLADRLVERR